MKKGIKFLSTLLIVVVFVLPLLSGCGGKKRVTINVFNWGEYIGETVIEEFEKKYNIKVNYEVFETNEDMYIKIKSGGANYDVAIPSDYMIKRMIDEDLLYTIDFANVPNYKYIDQRFKGLDYDPDNEYSVPYMWGTVGILYNKKMVKEKVDSWKILWDPKYRKQILMLDSQRDSIGVALKMLGYSMNTRSLSELEEAKEALIEQKPLVLSYVVNEVKDKMVAGEAALAVVWSGDAVAAMRENPDLVYVIPKEGSNLWVDAMVIPKTSKHKKEAELFINFMCETAIAHENADYIGYNTPHTEVLKLLDPDLVNDRTLYPREEDIGNLEIFVFDKDMVREYDRAWTEVKAK